jgi:Flp pilus assembly pilin Flp
MRELIYSWRRVREDEDGATATEYVVLLVFIALALFIGAFALGRGLNNILEESCDQLVEEAGENLDATIECE